MEFDDILYAKSVVSRYLHRTPVFHSKTFSDMFHGDIFFKMENFQKTGSFKSRGAVTKFSRLSDEELKNGVITASAGNHAQGVAYAASIFKTDAKIVMPENTTPAKVNAVEAYGGHVILTGRSYDESHSHALKIAMDENRTFIEAYNDEAIIAGQGTIALELFEDLGNLDQIIVPIGGGGLISGIAFAAKHINPNVKIIGVESEKANAMMLSLRENRIVPYTSSDTIADGIAVKYPGDITFDIVKNYVDDVVTVNDESIAYSLFKLLEREKVLVEPSGAVGLAALYEGKIDSESKKTAIILSGGNINFLLLSKIIYKSMEMENKLIRLEFNLPDRPGTMVKIVNAISSVGANIYHAEVDNLKKNTPIGYQNLTFTVNIVDANRIEKLLNALDSLGYKYNIIN
ncbi:threonine ammonia-lyase [Picrophilus oshimae]|uniref:threonine ammonia-lyase n=1 Tax=Picrophilus torridus (strain ATCC 700027 / DSM 9790 / JCM 10055 / NBRC 100828 / KAW 2/3) TaxID=1122961 RepID=Q6L2H9_PICTO|nr:threonine ammonia-lyase [Picrophilus oshimae]AAT42823.1 threonine dehydratase [Picrophilus oshimae DSM 9789]